MTGGRHGIDDDWRLLALKFVHGADASAGKSLLKFEDLRIVWRDDQDIVERNRDSLPFRSTHVVPDPRMSAMRSRIASASSGDEL